MNHPWLEIWLECRRLAARTVWRIQAVVNRRRLRKAAHKLGELGWQQAHYDPRDLAANELQTAEKQQARLLFDIAENKEQIIELQTATEEKTSALQTALRQAGEHASHCETHAVGLLTALEIERNRQAPDYLIESIKKTILEDEMELRQARTALHNWQDTLAEHQKQAQSQLDTLRTNLKKLETELRDLDCKKTTHFAQIGHNLADAGIAPLNQPQILSDVLNLRKKSTELQTRFAASLAKSGSLSRVTRFGAYLLVGLIFVAAALLLRHQFQ